MRLGPVGIAVRNDKQEIVLSTAKKKGGSKFSTSLIIGLLLVPLSAVAAVALVNPDAAADPETEAVAQVVIDDTTQTTAADEYIAQEIASSDDLELACGDDPTGKGLVVAPARRHPKL